MQFGFQLIFMPDPDLLTERLFNPSPAAGVQGALWLWAPPQICTPLSQVLLSGINPQLWMESYLPLHWAAHQRSVLLLCPDPRVLALSNGKGYLDPLDWETLSLLFQMLFDWRGCSQLAEPYLR